MQQIRNYLSDIMVKTELDAMEVDLSLVATPEAAPPESKTADVASAPRRVPASQVTAATTGPEHILAGPAGEQVSESVQPVSPESELLPAAQTDGVAKERVEASGEVKHASKAPMAADSESLELSEEDIEALKEMSAAFRAFKSLVLGLARLLQK